MSDTPCTARNPGLSTKGKLFALLVGTLAGLVCAELGLRLFWQNTYAGAAPSLIYKMRLENANASYRIDRRKIDAETPTVAFRTDDRSYLLPSFQYERPDATITFLGGSTTECMAVQEPLRFHALVSDLLGQRGLKVNTLNAARSGNTLHDSLNTLLNHVVNDKPDIAIVMHVMNDAGVLMHDGNYRSRLDQPVSWKDSVEWLSQALSSRLYVVGALRTARYSLAFGSIRPNDAKILLARNDPARADGVPIALYEQRLRSCIHVCRDFGIEPVLMTEPLVYSTSEYRPDWGDTGAQDRFNGHLVKVAEEEGVAVIDLVKHLHDHVPDWDKEMVVFYDGAHVTDNGSKIYARHIAEQIEPVVRRVVSERSASAP